MIQTTKEITRTLYKVDSRNETLQLRTKTTPASILNAWMLNFSEWISILEQWKLEGNLIDRLVTLSVMGEEITNRRLRELQGSLKNFMDLDVRALEASVLDMQRNINLLERCVISSEEKIRESKIRIQQLSATYAELKNNILREIANVYPVTFH